MAIHGVYVGNMLTDLQRYISWSGIKPGFVEAHGERRDWNGFQSTTRWLANDGSTICKGGVPLYWSIPLITQGSSLADGARGAFNGQYDQQARTILAASPGSDPIWVRTGWEHNGDWQPWAAAGKEESYRGCFRQFVDAFRKVSNRFRFIYCPNHGLNDAWKSYPGRDWVDVIGSDIYWKREFDGNDPVAAWEKHLGQAHGYQWVVDAARQEGKLASFDEIGVTGNNAGPYLERAFAFFAANPVVHHVGWWMSDAAFPGNLAVSGREASGRTFLALLKAANSGTAPAPNPNPTPTPTPNPIMDVLAVVNGEGATVRGIYPEPANGAIRQAEHHAFFPLAAAGYGGKSGTTEGEETDPSKALALVRQDLASGAGWPAEAEALRKRWLGLIAPLLPGGEVPDEGEPEPEPEPEDPDMTELQQRVTALSDEVGRLRARLASIAQMAVT